MTTQIWAKAKVGTRLGSRSPRTIRMMPRTIMMITLFLCRCFGRRIAGSVPEGALRLGPSLLTLAWTARGCVSGRVFPEPPARFFVA